MIMKTIFIPIFLGHQARNVLQTDVFRKLKENPQNRIIIFTKPAKKDFYKNKYGADNVLVESIEYGPISRLGIFLMNLALIAVDTGTIKKRQLKEFYRGNNIVLYFLKRLITKVFGNIKIFQVFLRYVDQHLVYSEILEKYFYKYNPDLIFSPNVIGKFDTLFLKTAKKLGVKSVAMVNSWDNLSSRGMIRVLPDILLVHNEIIRKEAIHLNGYPEDHIKVVGMPHFDYYLNAPFCTKEEFYKKMAIPLEKEIILFCPAGSRMNDTEWQVVKMLDDSIKNREINFPAHLLVRQPPNADMVMGELGKSESITFDRMSHKFETDDPNDWEWDREDITHLANSLFYSKMVLNYASTMSIDAAALDKPIINIVFDGWEKKSKKDSFSWFYDNLTHYKNLSVTGGVRSVYSMGSLVTAINSYYSDPKLDKEGRNRIVVEQCWKLDGGAGKRVAELITSFL